MYRYGHYGAALVCTALVVVILIVAGFAELGLLAGVAAIDLTVVPDFDQRVPFVTHRGLTDTIWFALLVGVIIAGVAVAIAIASVVVSALVGFVAGTVTVVSHIAADGLTPAGVRPRAPLDDTHYSLNIVTAANPLANYELLGIRIVFAAGAVWLRSIV